MADGKKAPFEEYSSPRWSHELLDCSMPMTFDQYSVCSYQCLYCFAYYQKSVGAGKEQYFARDIKAVSLDKIKKIFAEGAKSPFSEYIKARKTMQWGGMADPFDNYEKHYRVGLDIIRFFREIEYPVSFSTKANWFVHDEEYLEALNAPHFHFKVSIITGNEYRARSIERGAPTVKERLDTIEQLAKLNVNRVVLRFRPFIIGVSDFKNGHIQLIRDAAAAGATAVSTEFFCLERRTPAGHYDRLSAACGFDILQYYKENTPVATGYLRLNRELKRKYVEEMINVCKDCGMDFYISDPHFKERCAGGSCCGISEKQDGNLCRNYSEGQFTQAIVIARRNGKVYWKDIADGMQHFERVTVTGSGKAMNVGGTHEGRMRTQQTLKEYVQEFWNSPKSSRSPFKYFGGILKPGGLDEDGNIIYVYDRTME